MLETLVKHLDMVRLSARATMLLGAVALMGCSGLIDSGGGSDSTLTPEEVAARAAFTEKAKTHLDQNCAACHAGSDPTVAFLVGANAMEERATLMGFDPQVVNLDAPQSSRLLTKREHSGPALTAQQSSEILQWINAERDAAGATGTVDTGLETAAFTPVFCTSGNPGDPTCPITTIDISGLVEGWAGAKIKFVATPLSQDLYVTNLELEGGPEGVYLEHPLFVSWPPQGDPIPDTLDRFFNIKLNMMPGAMPEQIGGGTAAFINFTPTNQLTIHFKAVDKYRPDDGGTGTGGGTTGATGCKQVASFVTNARATLQTNCASCHANAGNSNARGAMDITGVANAGDATMMQNVCNQVRTRINFSDTNASGFYIAPNPAMATGHDFKFGTQGAFDTFKAAVDVWVQAEKTSP
jgi:mono/diheme cytochrome c family protein